MDAEFSAESTPGDIEEAFYQSEEAEPEDDGKIMCPVPGCGTRIMHLKKHFKYKRGVGDQAHIEYEIPERERPAAAPLAVVETREKWQGEFIVRGLYQLLRFFFPQLGVPVHRDEGEPGENWLEEMSEGTQTIYDKYLPPALDAYEGEAKFTKGASEFIAVNKGNWVYGKREGKAGTGEPVHRPERDGKDNPGSEVDGQEQSIGRDRLEE